MKRFRIAFHGRPVGSIGVSSFQVLDVEAETEEEAKLSAYKTHEHITGGVDGIKVVPVRLFASKGDSNA